MTTRNYEIRVTGSIGPAAREAFSGMGVDVEPISTVLSGPLDKDGLQRTLDRVRALGLELLGVRQVPAVPGKSLSRTDRGDSRIPDAHPGPAGHSADMLRQWASPEPGDVPRRQFRTTGIFDGEHDLGVRAKQVVRDAWSGGETATA